MIELLLQAERALSVGLLDRAETLYRQVAAADPRNSIAVVGLARVALDRGDETAALELARRALTIDPENVAAQRLVQRLEEVRAYRDEPELELTTPEAKPGPEPEPTPPEPTPEMEPIPPEPAPTPEPEPAPPELASGPTPPPRRRSWLDRLFRRNR
jgi:tetratricopeptide (TPR) repeat protein